MNLPRKELLRLARTGAEDGYDNSFHAQITSNKFFLAEMQQVAAEAKAALENQKPEYNDRRTVR